jgi:hypothetical protein
MVGIFHVQSNKIAFVYTQLCPSILGSKRQNLFVRSGLVRVASFQGGQNVVAQEAQSLDH